MNDTSFEAFLSSYPPDVQALALAARELVRQALPEAQETIDPPSKIVAYGASPRYADLVCAIGPFSAHVNLMFSRGASLPDPAGLLRGTGKKARHVRLQSLEDLQQPGLAQLLAAAREAALEK